MRHECSNCKYFACEVMGGDGRALEYLGECLCKAVKKRGTESDDYCNHYEKAAWFAQYEEVKNELS